MLPPAPPGTDESSSELPETPGGFPLARFPRKAKSVSPARSPRRKSPASSPSGGRGSKRPISSSPAQSSPRKKAKTAASTGFTSSESDFFSMDNDDEDDNEVTLNLKVPAEPSQKNLANPDDQNPAPAPQPHPSKAPRRPIPSKNMQKVAQQHNMARARRGGRSTFQQVAFWNLQAGWVRRTSLKGDTWNARGNSTMPKGCYYDETVLVLWHSGRLGSIRSRGYC